jgi:hypothetical protein
MNHRDALVSSVTVVLDERFVPEKVDEIVVALKGLGLDVCDINASEGVVEGTIESAKVKAVESLECVDCVRTTFSYVADYPAGDQRDQDGPEDPDTVERG